MLNDMKNILVIGSTVVDVILRLPYLPGRGEDVNILSSSYQIGGCAYNVYQTLRKFNIPGVLCSPLGTGRFADFISDHFIKEGIKPFVRLDVENGCCYCLIEPDGERSFLSQHGAEYIFNKSWMKNIDYSITEDIFISGIDVEDPTGIEIVDFIYEHEELSLYFAPGPRILHIDNNKINAILSRRDKYGRGPFLHLNEREALLYTGQSRAEDAAKILSGLTLNDLVITLGARGSYAFSKVNKDKPEGFFIQSTPALGEINTLGAGDVHLGTVIACMKMGIPIREACIKANEAAVKKISI